MSYFIVGAGDGEGATGEFEKLLCDIAPLNVRNLGLRVSTTKMFLASYGVEKVIRDLVVRNEQDGSWLVLIGTPLVQWPSEKEKRAFLAAFLADPARTVRELVDGNFAIFAYDAPAGRLVAATDFNTTIPVFYSTAPGGILFSSHELALARLVKAEIDPFGFAQAIHMGATWGSGTRFRGVYKMLPCQVCVVDEKGNFRSEPYWRPQEETVSSSGLDGQIERWMPLLRGAVGKYYECSGRKPVIADFTAGEDGRLLLAQCHSLGIPFKAHVTGLDGDTDVVIAKQAASIARFDLITRRKHQVAKEELLANASQISLQNDAYQDFFKSCTEFATDRAAPLDDYGTVKFCGLPGGEAFRGSYYLRGKAFFPSNHTRLDCEFFTKMKYLLDFQPQLLKFSDPEFLDAIHTIAKDNLAEVKDFPIGTQIDHMLRMFQTCLLGLKYKNPVYLPLATGPMTRSIYWLSPRYKRGGKLTKACTELLFPELAFVKTQNGVPTIRKTMSRLPLFMPEYLSLFKKISSGTLSRLLKWTKPNKWYYSDEWTAHIFKTLLDSMPYSAWFSSSDTMATGHLYNSDALNTILDQARLGTGVDVPVLGRIISSELACRWVFRVR